MRLQDAARLVEAGHIVGLRPSGHSMDPIIRHRQFVRIEPATAEPEVGDVVLAKVRGRWLLHKIGAKRDGQYRIENARGRVNGWTSQVLGRVIPGP